MTEAEWLACDDLGRILALVEARASERKLTLLACACCRRVWPLLLFEASRRAVEIAERFADGLEEVAPVGDAGVAAYNAELCIEAVVHPPSSYDVETETEAECREVLAASGFPGRAVLEAAKAAAWLCDSSSVRRVLPAILSCTATAASLAARAPGAAPDQEAAQAERRAQAGLARDLLGDLVLPARLAASWLTALVRSVARAADDERALPSGALDPARLAVLADALEDAGCTDAAVLGHLRGPGPHARGCWAVDLILAKEPTPAGPP
jgi:hypothetical protein